MGFLARLFGTDPEGRIARARKLIERQQWGDARREVEDLDHPAAQALLAEANDHLVSMNLDEALARIQAGEPEGAQEHMELARVFGASSGQLRAVRRAAREAEEAEAEAEAERKLAEEAASVPEGNDPLWSLPPDDPRLRYALLLESWPESLRERLAGLGPDYARAVMMLEDGDADAAREALSPFVSDEPASRFDRARAALAAGNPMLAASDLATFGDKVGHQLIGQTHTAVLLAQLWARNGRAEQALDMVDETRKTDTGLALAGTRLSLLEAMGRHADAATGAEQLLRTAPKDQGLYRLLARCRMRLDNRAGAAGALEASLAKTCSSPGKCGNQSYDVEAARMLAILYLEDQQHHERVDELVRDIRGHAQQPAWEDGYIQGLLARNEGDLETAGRIGQEITGALPEGDPRRGLVQRSLRALPVA
jgi:tetratricopeptide (TPR) repeat protein